MNFESSLIFRPPGFLQHFFYCAKIAKSGRQAARFIGVKQRNQDARPQEYTKIAREAQKRRKKEEKKGKKKERKKKRGRKKDDFF